MIVVIFIIPSSINHSDDDLWSKTDIDAYFERLKSSLGSQSTLRGNGRPMIMRSDIRSSDQKISYLTFFKNRRAMMAIISSILAMIFMLFFDGILAIHLISEMDVSDNEAGNHLQDQCFIGYYFALCCFTYAVSSPIVGCLMYKVPRRYITCCSFFLAFFALLMFGPSQIL